MSSVEAEGRTIEEAIAAALQQLRAERDQVEIEILSQATKGFLGIGGKKARVRATLRVALSARPVEPEPAPVRARTERGRRTDTFPRETEDDDEAALPSKETGEKANTMLKEVLRLMGMEATSSLALRDGEAIISITGPAANTLIGRIKIPRLDIAAIIREGAEARTLQRAVGHIPGTALPGESGNVGLAGHRDTFFRRLSRVKTGDTIVLSTADGIYRYEVRSTSIVSPRATSSRTCRWGSTWRSRGARRCSARKRR
jgi:LPXTG-site transpeptidase (sortase) family protein